MKAEHRISGALALLAVLGLGLGTRPAARAISKAPATSTPGNAQNPAEAAPPDEVSALSKIVSRLSAGEHQQARDWAELGRETATWGGRLQSQQQPVPEGPVRDALAAVDIGRKLDPQASDWSKLREELQALLKKPDEDKKDQQQQPKDQQDQNDQQQQQQQNQDQKNQQDQKKSDQQKQNEQQQNQSDKNQQSNDQQQQQESQKQEKKDQGESAFGDMSKKDQPPPPPPQNMQKVGGTPEKKPEQKEAVDPALALPMQKLEQLKNQDSPAQLFQLMEGERKPTQKKGKDW